jgi:hypothetical protein
MVKITLTLDQMRLAKTEAEARQRAVEARKGRSLGPSKNPLGQNIIGVMGELAFATWSGLPWTASRGAALSEQLDVGNCEVRTRRRATDQDLFVKNNKFGKQSPSTFYVLAIADEGNPEVILVGWTILAMIFEYGYPRQFDCTGYPKDQLCDMEVLHAKR